MQTRSARLWRLFAYTRRTDTVSQTSVSRKGDLRADDYLAWRRRYIRGSGHLCRTGRIALRRQGLIFGENFANTKGEKAMVEVKVSVNTVEKDGVPAHGKGVILTTGYEVTIAWYDAGRGVFHPIDKDSDIPVEDVETWVSVQEYDKAVSQ